MRKAKDAENVRKMRKRCGKMRKDAARDAERCVKIRKDG
jgi:hypothetical protein